jgi:hypothetical protein
VQCCLLSVCCCLAPCNLLAVKQVIGSFHFTVVPGPFVLSRNVAEWHWVRRHAKTACLDVVSALSCVLGCPLVFGHSPVASVAWLGFVCERSMWNETGMHGCGCLLPAAKPGILVIT